MTVKIRPISKTDSLRTHERPLPLAAVFTVEETTNRIVLPIELRRTLDIAEKDSIEIYVDGSSIILKKYEPTCVFCGDAKNITVYKGKNICANCLKELKKA